jgi:hypothetical protein
LPCPSCEPRDGDGYVPEELAEGRRPPKGLLEPCLDNGSSGCGLPASSEATAAAGPANGTPAEVPQPSVGAGHAAARGGGVWLCSTCGLAVRNDDGAALFGGRRRRPDGSEGGRPEPPPLWALPGVPGAASKAPLARRL